MKEEGRRGEKKNGEKNDLILVVQPCWASAWTTNSTGPSAMTRCTFIFYLQYRAIHIRHWFVKIGGNTIFETNVKQKVFKKPKYCLTPLQYLCGPPGVRGLLVVDLCSDCSVLAVVVCLMFTACFANFHVPHNFLIILIVKSL